MYKEIFLAGVSGVGLNANGRESVNSRLREEAGQAPCLEKNLRCGGCVFDGRGDNGCCRSFEYGDEKRLGCGNQPVGGFKVTAERSRAQNVAFGLVLR